MWREKKSTGEEWVWSVGEWGELGECELCSTAGITLIAASVISLVSLVMRNSTTTPQRHSPRQTYGHPTGTLDEHLWEENHIQTQRVGLGGYPELPIPLATVVRVEVGWIGNIALQRDPPEHGDARTEGEKDGQAVVDQSYDQGRLVECDEDLFQRCNGRVAVLSDDKETMEYGEDEKGQTGDAQDDCSRHGGIRRGRFEHVSGADENDKIDQQEDRHHHGQRKVAILEFILLMFFDQFADGLLERHDVWIVTLNVEEDVVHFRHFF